MSFVQGPSVAVPLGACCRFSSAPAFRSAPRLASKQPHARVKARFRPVVSAVSESVAASSVASFRQSWLGVPRR